ncbi:unnamed protein product [Didymodactylos carnosus]|uniref:LamG-like jellyroll fold domain-containing protein n=2 Tax=Didymodactylos carnosus TaxID=1234261 RepID=A0A8S2DTD4_9BILA|nr:unnamed protein product [Didymodactylos carnosus]CAF3772990.1 unnamed protein product [Didymodactylos carnosus]
MTTKKDMHSPSKPLVTRVQRLLSGSKVSDPFPATASERLWISFDSPAGLTADTKSSLTNPSTHRASSVVPKTPRASSVVPKTPRASSVVPKTPRLPTASKTQSELTSPTELTKDVISSDNKKFKNSSKIATLWKKIPLSYKILCIVALAIIVIAVSIIPPIVLFHNKNNIVNSTSSASLCSVSTCIKSFTTFRSNAIALWTFDGSSTDVNYLYNGIAYGSVSYPVAAFIGKSILFDNSASEYVSVPFIDLTYQSFTVQAWISPNSVSSEQGIFGQCVSTSLKDQCLVLSLRNGRLHMSLNSDNEIFGNTLITAGNWYHVTFVYDYALLQQSIYYNGVLDGSSAALGVSGPYVGTSGTITIGYTTSTSYPNGYYYGNLDNVVLTNYAKTSCQILNDATLVAYYPFDSTTQPYLDYGPYYFSAVYSQTITVTGRVGNALLFNSSSAYFQSQSFVPPLNANQAFTISLWLNPNSISGGTILHASVAQNGTGLCYDLLVLTSTGTLVAQTYKSGNSPAVTAVQGPALSTNTWSHVVFSYSVSNGMKLYLNGALNSYSSSALATSQYNYALYLTIGNSLPGGGVSSSCLVGSITVVSGRYQGTIDELYVYMRELSVSEICTLANP